MQISSATVPNFGSQNLSPFQSAQAAKGAGAHAGAEAAAGAVAAVEESHNSAETASAKTKDHGQNLAHDHDAESDATSAKKDPLTDPASREYAQVKELAARDREVRAHEQAHLAAAGKYAASGMSFSYQTGPDGQKYAIGGEVSIDVSSIPDDPAATIAKMQVVQRAATAPAEPSAQDARVAAQAAQTAAAARAELAAQQFEKTQSAGSSDVEKPKPENQSEDRQTSNEREASKSYKAQQAEQTQPSFSASA